MHDSDGSGLPGASGALASEADLRRIYRKPGGPALQKQLDRLDEHCRAFVAHAPLMMVATSGADGMADVSPKGGPPGFVRVLDDTHLAFGDLAGNNRLDSLGNLMAGRGIGLLFLIPGLDETLRVNGLATVTTEPDVLEACRLDGERVTPRAAVAVEVREAYIHCAKAFRRARAWEPEAWPDRADLASPACMLRDHIGLSMSDSEVEQVLEEGYRTTMWEPGG